MGASVSTAVNDSYTNIRNTVFQEANNTCTATCSNLQEGDVIIISGGSNVGGNIILDQQCTADSLCVMRTNLDSIVQQGSITNQDSTAKAKQPWFSANVATTYNYSTTFIENMTTQIITNVCEAIVENIQRNITILIDSGSNVVGDVQLTQSGSATANCAIDASASSSVTQTSSTDQTATSVSGSDLSAIIIALICAGALVAAMSTKKKDDKKAEGSKATQK